MAPRRHHIGGSECSARHLRPSVAAAAAVTSSRDAAGRDRATASVNLVHGEGIVVQKHSTRGELEISQSVYTVELVYLSSTFLCQSQHLLQ
ncbi:hypothetical protein FA95DRAFT_1567511 [Auriscalpium vulgare]|uniref:Uncharacterized protein n=1 Tax=Auriscalpium vulgare TaxID=40419 RepID=A0ACB8R5M2_9AGAM|nr:hypothetical protein FA95DRAFT_1567511 [Auriscalpium vulgare]